MIKVGQQFIILGSKTLVCKRLDNVFYLIEGYIKKNREYKPYKSPEKISMQNQNWELGGIYRKYPTDKLLYMDYI